ncbi:COBW domain-containing protein, putative [Perkinsus marinus ATCC 50983]|uniref:COBW domain-containing protein, putative n=1 Tax=Perkinsus marinus (strain ATCC 50983 / TXsc) TaxID=423536 RepID=C5K9N0_PERM5|nr:COBW domain-containing protein, putative [Perkinsus marinus ATCC 50983]EER18802.1 COBW domain-containing protein, putative [Perkinsus marinus ATCC 50983]|eukprot:XP_002787006.1 COBW domain-containing protein, putative [Perkinsus marinus ATCC 50983]
MLRESKGRFFVLNNEIGGISVSELPDNYASGSSGDCSTVYELGGGCLCCNLRNDLMAKLEGLGKKALAAPSDDPVNGIILETTGLATPGPVVQGLVAQPPEGIVLRKVVTLVDASNFIEQYKRVTDPRSSELVQQLVFADLVIINKCDLVDDQTAAQIEDTIRSINPVCRLVRTVHSDISMEEVLRSQGDTYTSPGDLNDVPQHKPWRDGVCSCALSGPYPASKGVAIDIEKFRAWLQDFVENNRVFRVKGMLIAGDGKRYLLQGVEKSFQLVETDCPSEMASKVNKLVVIGQRIQEHMGDEIDKSLNALLVDRKDMETSKPTWVKAYVGKDWTDAEQWSP